MAEPARYLTVERADYLATDPRTLRKVYRKFDPSHLLDVADALAL
jgi:hypothetical protein